MFHTTFLAVAKKHLRLRCCQCTRLLPSEHFPKKKGPLNTLVCADCKEMCFGCGLRQPRSSFSDAGSNICDRCLAKRQVAKENVYFRYPILKYRACPFRVDDARDELRKEDQQREQPHMHSSHASFSKPPIS
ncbi:hypothetical protein GH5_05275 [Leishmania sp. Ghana 2012 LV757]|uniref:hypothetical protein n=1 Tax=Leishmania sp. Ghana 2012 LV757 TaxID=2803181 RepID=UPI001B5B25EA|nr:hypothetical protein GH5_05275 [Leishmania sp. Ghana 2012 LV757]